MKRKICITLLALALFAGSILPASALRMWHPSPVCVQHFLCAFGCYRFCLDAKPDSPDQPIVPEEPSEPIIPEQPSVPNTPDDLPGNVHEYEREVVRLVNIEREKNGLPTLTLREDLCIHARVKSQDMRSGGYFSHTSPTYGSPFEMMQSFGKKLKWMNTMSACMPIRMMGVL